MSISKLKVDEKSYNIKFWNIPDDKYNEIVKLFKIDRQKPIDKRELFVMYISLIRKFIHRNVIIISRYGREQKKIYKLNIEWIKNNKSSFHIETQQYLDGNI
jgi:hypothetical protein